MSVTQSYTAGNQDLEAIGALETFLHTGELHSYFVRGVCRGTPFAKMDAEIERVAGTVQYGASFEAVVPPIGDYLLHVYLEVELGAVELADDNRYGPNGALGYVANLGHNLFRKASLIINEMEVASLDGKFLDAQMEFMTDGAKHDGYRRMVGNDCVLNPSCLARGRKLDRLNLLVPLPFFFSSDSGNALPMATLTRSDVRLRFELRRWDELMVLEDRSKVSCSVTAPREADLKAPPSILGFRIKCDFALASQQERRAMGCTTRYMLIEQPVTHPLTELTVSAERPTATVSYDAPLGAIKAMYFGAVNMTHGNLPSHYRVGCPATSGPSRVPEGARGPALASVGLRYDDEVRIPVSDTKLFTQLHPYYYARRVPAESSGLHFYSFALRPEDSDPTGTSNPGAAGRKLHFVVTATPAMIEAASNPSHPEKFGFSLTTVSYRLARISGGRFEMLRSDGKFRTGEGN